MARSEQKEKKAVIKKDIFVSAVLVINDSTGDVAEYIEKLSGLLIGLYTNYEIVVVDNGVLEKEVENLRSYLLHLPCIRVIRLARKSSYDTALFAGLEVAIGDYVCTVDSAVDPLEALPEIISMNQTKSVVQGVSEIPITSTFISRIGRHLFYWYNRRHIGIDIPLNATYFASYSRQAVNFITRTSRSQHHIRHLARRAGYDYATMPYKPLKNPGSPKKLKSGIIEALEIAVSYSTHPLRFVTWLGLIAGMANIFYAIYVLYVNASSSHIAEGWTTTSLQLSGMFFILFIILVIISEYIGRILIESYKDPNYLIADELTSAVSVADINRRNVEK